MSSAPLRYYDLLEQVDKTAVKLKADELTGAIDIMTIVSAYFYKLHFYDNEVIDQKCIVKTLEDIKELLLESEILLKEDAQEKTK